MNRDLFLLTTPEHDDTTAYCSKWSEEIVEKAMEKGLEVVNLNRSAANRKNFEDRLAAQKPVFIMFNGHGNNKTVSGHKNEALLSCDLKNEKLTENSFVYARSCGCGAELGPSCIKQGCLVFIGYIFSFGFVYDTARTTTPKKDNIAAYFFRVSNAIPVAIVKGDKIEDAVRKADIQLQKELDYLRTHYTPEAQNIIPWLLWNKSVRVILGDKNASINARRNDKFG